MTRSCCDFLIPFALMAMAAGIAVWSGIVVSDNHDASTFLDTPRKMPLWISIVGAVAVYVCFGNLFRFLGCTGKGWFNSGLGFTSLLLVAGSSFLLFYHALALNKDDRDFYKHEMKSYYNLAMGEAIYILLYALVLVYQLIVQIYGSCCNCKSAGNQYEYVDETRQIYA